MSEVKNEEAITLTFEPFAAEAAPAPAQAEAPAQEAPKVPEIDDSMLTEAEKKMVKTFSDQIDISNSAMVMQYGAGAQQKVASFSEKALDNVRTKDLGEVGNLITDVVTELKGFDEDEKEKGFFGHFKKTANKMATMKTKYEKTEKNIDTIVEQLEKHQMTLMKDSASLDQLYALNLNYYKELTMYIIAGRKKLAEVQNVTIPALREKAAKSGLQEDAQQVNDMVALADRFDKKLHDLELTRMVAMQMGPQIRLVQNNDIVMSDKIQSTIVNTIPLWKSQMVIALGVAHSEEAAKAQREVTDLTNAMLKKNAEQLKMATINTAKEAERGVVDIETLTQTNEMLISTLDEVMQIQDEGRQKRREAETELRRIEDEMRKKLLQIR